MTTTTANRYHDISCGHRVYGHENKCAHLHGHNYRIHFYVAPLDSLDSIGRVLDFSVIKERLCQWLEDNWDHKMLIWQEDPLSEVKEITCDSGRLGSWKIDIASSVVVVPFNPTAENMSEYLVQVIGPHVLDGTGTQLVQVTIEETRKCSVTYSLK